MLKLNLSRFDNNPLRFIWAISIISVIIITIFAISISQTNSQFIIALNNANARQYQNDTVTQCKPIQTGEVLNSQAYSISNGMCIKGSIKIIHQEQTTADINLLREGYNASCLFYCNGITYTQDPTAIMTNNGHDFMFNCKDFGTSSVISCQSADLSQYMELSTSSTTPLVTDTGCGGGAGSGQITSGGLADVTGTFTAGTASSGSVTSTLSHTWTAAETDSNVQLLCINTEAHTGTHIILVYELTFGPDTLISGNILTITLSVTAT